MAGKVVIGTGAGSGIGRAPALRCASAGALVVANDWNATTLAETVELAKTGGGADILRVLALFSDADREASPEKDFGAWTHVDVLGGRIVAALA